MKEILILTGVFCLTLVIVAFWLSVAGVVKQKYIKQRYGVDVTWQEAAWITVEPIQAK